MKPTWYAPPSPRSLFAKDKLLFSFLMCVKVLEVNSLMLRFFMTGGVDTGQQVGPAPSTPPTRIQGCAVTPTPTNPPLKATPKYAQPFG